MKIRTFLAWLFVISFGAVPALAQICDPSNYPTPRYSAPAVQVPLTVYLNPCAPYAWCGPRDVWGNPVYAAPAYTTYPQVHGNGYGAATVAGETVQPRVNGWTGAVEYRRENPHDGLIAY